MSCGRRLHRPSASSSRVLQLGQALLSLHTHLRHCSNPGRSCMPSLSSWPYSPPGGMHATLGCREPAGVNGSVRFWIAVSTRLTTSQAAQPGAAIKTGHPHRLSAPTPLCRNGFSLHSRRFPSFIIHSLWPCVALILAINFILSLRVLCTLPTFGLTKTPSFHPTVSLCDTILWIWARFAVDGFTFRIAWYH